MKKKTIALLLCLLCAAGFAQNTIYVRSNGSDSNAGTSENTSFKTLAKAVETASKTKIKTIIVIGTLVGQTEIKDSGTDEILITGKANASGNDKAMVTTKAEADENGMIITGNSNIRLENITVTGNYLSGIYVEGKNAKLVLGKGTVITGNGEFEDSRATHGGGVLVINGTLIMQADALVKGNFTGTGGGGITIQNGVFIMKEKALITENSTWGDGGGIILLKNSTMTIQDNASVLNNTAEGDGGGILVYASTLTLQDNAGVLNNTADGAGGGVYIQSSALELKNNSKISGNIAKVKSWGGGGINSFRGTILLRDNSSVTGNTSPEGGGIFMKVSELETVDKVKIEGSGIYESRQVTGNKSTEDYLGLGIPHNILVDDH
jgi:hypothetical protein